MEVNVSIRTPDLRYLPPPLRMPARDDCMPPSSPSRRSCCPPLLIFCLCESLDDFIGVSNIYFLKHDWLILIPAFLRRHKFTTASCSAAMILRRADPEFC